MAEKRRILFIDDDPVDRKFISRLLSKYDFEVLLAEDAPTGMRMAQEGRIDIILLDILLPHISGIELCKEFKKNPLTQDIPIIFYTSVDTPKNVINYSSYGARDYIQKNTPPQELLNSINYILQTG